MRIIVATAIALTTIVASPAMAQLEFERDPINYSKSTPTDAISKLQEKLASGETKLTFDESHGYLKSLLQALNVPESSQVLVFSKTSFQRHRISRRTPRAVYFNDDVYLGWVQRGDVIEISAADPQLGAVFYTLDQEESVIPKIQRQNDHCMICHASTHTGRVPGHIVRSVYADMGGMPVYSAGTFRTNHTSPFKERWGGWYVSGTHGDDRHMGNVQVQSKLRPEELDTEAGANVTDLGKLIKTKPYLTPHSDIVALMTLEHQTMMHNRITEANFQGRTTTWHAGVMNRALDRPTDFVSESIARRYQSAADKVLQCLLMADEYPLKDPVKGTSDFAKEFASRGPFDKRGRSLRQFDLQSRLFRYPCSYLIYSQAFDALPSPVRDLVYQDLWAVLTGKPKSDEDPYAHLTVADRTAIREILRDTKRGLPEYWE